MTINAKIWVLNASLTVIVFIMAGLNWYSNETLAENAETIIQLNAARSTLNQLQLSARTNREQILLALQHDPANPTIAALHDHPLSAHLDTINKGREEGVAASKALDSMPIVHRLLDNEMRQLYEARAHYRNSASDPTIALIQAGNFEQATASLIQKLNPAITALFNKGNDVAKAIDDHIKYQENEALALTSRLNTIIVITVILANILSLLLGIAIRRSIRGAITEVSNAISSSATNMSFTQALPTRKDEFAKLVNDTNHLFSSLNSSINEANSVLTAISKADFNQRMTGQYVGDLARLQQGINDSAGAVSFMMKELESVMQVLGNGNFHTSMDPKVPQAFRNLVETSLKNVSMVIDDINLVMTQMAHGNFNGRVSATAAGELSTLKDNINQSVSAMASAITAISDVVSAQAQGDLTKSLPSGTFKGQLHDLKNAINYSTSKVKDSVIQAVHASNIVSSAAAQVSQGANDLSGRVQQQAAALEQTSATMHQMASAVQTNTANAQQVADLTNQVKDQSGSGVAVMQQTIVAMQSIREASNKIADIVTLIDGIAFQTNLLALNAAVEAARAGEHGRGFAVVAGEVRALAGKSADAAKDIKTLISDSVHRVENGTQLAERSGEMLNGISLAIEQVAEMINQIAAASHEQSIGIGQVHLAMNNIDQITQENAALVEETTAAAESLNTEANNLNANMSFFNTGVVHHEPKHATLRKPSKSSPTAVKTNPNDQDWGEF